MARKPDKDKVPWKYVRAMLDAQVLDEKHFHCPICDIEIQGDKQEVAEHIRVKHTLDDVIMYMQEWEMEIENGREGTKDSSNGSTEPET